MVARFWPLYLLRFNRARFRHFQQMACRVSMTF